jgi:beta-lactamase class A
MSSNLLTWTPNLRQEPWSNLGARLAPGKTSAGHDPCVSRPVLRPALAALLLLVACAPPVAPPTTVPEPVPTVVAGTTARPPTPRATSRPAPTQKPVPSPSPVDPAQALAAALTPLLAGPAEVGVVVEHVPTGARFAHRASQPAPSASVYKLFVAHEVLARVDRGELRLADQLTIQPSDALEDGWEDVGDRLTVRQALDTMMGDSSNRAAFALLRQIGRAQMNARLVEAGYRNSSVPLLAGQRALPGSPPHDDEYAVSAPADLAALLRLVATEQTLTPASRAELRRLLALEETVEPLRDALPSSAVFAKNGWLPGVRNVAALVDSPTGPVVLAAFVDARTDAAAEAKLVDLARAVARLYGVAPA